MAHERWTDEQYHLLAELKGRGLPKDQIIILMRQRWEGLSSTTIDSKILNEFRGVVTPKDSQARLREILLRKNAPRKPGGGRPRKTRFKRMP